ARPELTDQLRQQVFADRHAAADEERPAELAAQVLQPRLELGRERQDALRVVERNGAGGREHDAALGAVEEAGIEILLELLDLERDGRLRHEKRIRRLGERQMLRDRVEYLKVSVRHPGILRQFRPRRLRRSRAASNTTRWRRFRRRTGA